MVTTGPDVQAIGAMVDDLLGVGGGELARFDAADQAAVDQRVHDGRLTPAEGEQIIAMGRALPEAIRQGWVTTGEVRGLWVWAVTSGAAQEAALAAAPRQWFTVNVARYRARVATTHQGSAGGSAGGAPQAAGQPPAGTAAHHRAGPPPIPQTAPAWAKALKGPMSTFARSTYAVGLAETWVATLNALSRRFGLRHKPGNAAAVIRPVAEQGASHLAHWLAAQTRSIDEHARAVVGPILRHDAAIRAHQVTLRQVRSTALTDVRAAERTAARAIAAASARLKYLERTGDAAVHRYARAVLDEARRDARGAQAGAETYAYRQAEAVSRYARAVLGEARRDARDAQHHAEVRAHAEVVSLSGRVTRLSADAIAARTRLGHSLRHEMAQQQAVDRTVIIRTVAQHVTRQVRPLQRQSSECVTDLCTNLQPVSRQLGRAGHVLKDLEQVSTEAAVLALIGELLHDPGAVVDDVHTVARDVIDPAFAAARAATGG